mmetsp:Transcript_19953/g.62547  ORF Transcript_19953/g.62547 Transcript_19953/m.62547 type:complete len:185 (+) Transcript_19953:1-555(+)
MTPDAVAALADASGGLPDGHGAVFPHFMPDCEELEFELDHATQTLEVACHGKWLGEQQRFDVSHTALFLAGLPKSARLRPWVRFGAVDDAVTFLLPHAQDMPELDPQPRSCDGARVREHDGDWYCDAAGANCRCPDYNSPEPTRPYDLWVCVQCKGHYVVCDVCHANGLCALHEPHTLYREHIS